jgi:ABC-type Mn2+/Zn2+ transport system ATPase subunit
MEALVTSPLVTLRDAAVGYGGVPVLRDVGLSVRSRDVLALVGANGAGKTTLLRTIAGVLRPIAGRVDRQPGLRIGYVPQESDLHPVFPLAALDVVLHGRLGRGRRLSGADRAAAVQTLERAGVAGLAATSFAALSGGQKQRVLVARALAAEPSLIVLDEPTRGMDPPSERSLMDLLARLSADGGHAIVFATHDLTLAANYAERLALVDRRRALVTVGTLAELLTEERLSHLYDAPMHVRPVDGWRTVFAGGAPC